MTPPREVDHGMIRVETLHAIYHETDHVREVADLKITHERELREMGLQARDLATRVLETEMQRRLEGLNHENERIQTVLAHTWSMDKGDAVMDRLNKLEAAIQVSVVGRPQQDKTVSGLSQWRSFVTGATAVLVLLIGWYVMSGRAVHP